MKEIFLGAKLHMGYKETSLFWLMEVLGEDISGPMSCFQTGNPVLNVYCVFHSKVDRISKTPII